MEIKDCIIDFNKIKEINLLFLKIILLLIIQFLQITKKSVFVIKLEIILEKVWQEKLISLKYIIQMETKN